MKTLNTADLFKLSFEYASCGKAIIDMEGKFIEVNESFCNIIGYSKEEILKMSTKEISPEACCITEKQEIAKLHNNQEVNVRYTTQRINKNGKTINLTINAIAIHSNGKESAPTHILKQIEKLSSTDKLIEKINQKQFLLDTIMREMPLKIYFKDLESKFILSSKEQAKNFKVKNESELIGKTDFDFFSSEHAQKAYDDEQNIIKTGMGIVAEEKLTWPNGSVTWAHSVKQPLKDANGIIIGTFGISSDITEKVKSERKIIETQEKLERKNKELEVILESLKEAQSQLVNSEKLAALGQLIAGIAHEINTPLGAINASSSNIKSSFEALIDNIENNIIKFSPTEIELLKILLANYKSNHVTQLVSRDKRRIKKEFSDKLNGMGLADASKISDVIVYINQHDHFETIIKYSGSTDLLNVLKAAKNLISLVKNSDNITVATEKASQVVLALKKYIHKTPDGDKQQTNIVDNIETVLTLNYNKIKQGVEIIKNYETIPYISAYPDELSQVWNNLITNAIHAMNNKGTITIDLINKEKTIIAKFTDTGSGIPKEIQEKIFTPFFTTKSSGEGTGLGLDIVKRIVEKHQGTLTLDSEMNKGTTFTIELPKN